MRLGQERNRESLLATYTMLHWYVTCLGIQNSHAAKAIGFVLDFVSC